jgi:hypothetical protein
VVRVAVAHNATARLAAAELLGKVITEVQQLPVAVVMLVAAVAVPEPQVQPLRRDLPVVLEELAFRQASAGHLRSTLVVVVAAEMMRGLLVATVAVVLAVAQPIQVLLALLILAAVVVETVMGGLPKQVVLALSSFATQTLLPQPLQRQALPPLLSAAVSEFIGGLALAASHSEVNDEHSKLARWRNQRRTPNSVWTLRGQHGLGRVDAPTSIGLRQARQLAHCWQHKPRCVH